MILSYGQVEAAIVAHLRVHPDKIGTLRARVKQLQKLQFPAGVNVGRGAKMHYSAEHLFKLVTAFELINVGLPALPATTIVERNWQQFSAGYGIAFRIDYRERAGRPRDVYFRVAYEVLSALTTTDDEDPYVDIVNIENAAMLQDELAYNPDIKGNSFLLLCASHIVRSVFFGCEIARVTDATADQELDTWPDRLPITMSWPNE